MKRSELLFTFLLLPLDMIAISAAFILAYFTRAQSEIIYIWTFGEYIRFVGIAVIIWVVIFALEGLYRPLNNYRNSLDELGSVFLGVSSGIMLVVAYFFLTRIDFFSRLVVMYSWAYGIIFVFVARQLVRLVQRYIRKYNIGIKKLIVIGNDNSYKDIISAINYDRSRAYKIVACIKPTEIENLNKYIEEYNADEVVISESKLSDKIVSHITDVAQQKGLHVKLVPNLFRVKSINTTYETIGGIPLIVFRRTPLDGWGAIIKRITDVILSIFLLIILSPLFLIIAAIIKITSPDGPIIFKQKRVGLKQDFMFLKFRSMVPSAHNEHEKLIKKHGNMFKLKKDHRITPFGEFLRKTSLDELPQLWNVLKGEMSLVGPRPPMPEEVKFYKPHQKRRLGIKPGITGLWQVSGRSDIDFEEWVRLDTFYIENWSLWLDIKILFKTFFIVIRMSGAY